MKKVGVMSDYRESFKVTNITPGKVHHKVSPKRGKTRYSDLTPAELKHIVMSAAGGSPAIMSRMTGVRSNYIVRAIRGHINISWEKADLLRSVRKETSMTTSAVTPTVSAGLDSLHPSMQEAVKTLIAKGKIVECSHCHEYFTRDLKHRNYCPACKRKGSTEPSSRKRKTPDIHKRKFIDCENPRCDSTLREWGGRKYCSDSCKKQAFNIRRSERRRKNNSIVTPEPNKTVSRESAPPSTPIKGQYTGFEGAPCHREDCGGVFTLKTNRRNGHRFYGCSWFNDENRPARSDKCRATALYIPEASKKLEEAVNQLAQINETKLPEPPKVQSKVSSNNKDIAEAILKELHNLSGELRDCIGRVVELERMVAHGNDNVNKLRQEVSDIHYNTEELYKQLTS